MSIRRLEKTTQMLILVHVIYFILIALSFFYSDVSIDKEEFNTFRYIFTYSILITLYHILFIIQALNEVNIFQLKFSFVFLANLLVIIIALIFSVLSIPNANDYAIIPLVMCCIMCILEFILLYKEMSQWTESFKRLYYIQFGSSYIVKRMWHNLLIKKPIWFVNNFV